MEPMPLPSAALRPSWQFPSPGLPLALAKTPLLPEAWLLALQARRLDDADLHRRWAPHTSWLDVAKVVERAARPEMGAHESEQTDPLALFAQQTAAQRTGEKPNAHAERLLRALRGASAHEV
jgi:hypothetical protein